MADRRTWVCTSYRPEPHPADEGTVSCLDRGYVYGDAVYETLRTYRSRIFGLDEHLARLASGASRIGYTEPPLQDLRKALQALAALRAPEESYLRITLSRGTQFPGWGCPCSEDSPWTIYSGPIPPYVAAWYERGVSCTISSRRRANPGGFIPAVKFACNQELDLAKREADARGAYEALLRNPAGDLAEGTSSNVFLVSRDRLITPSLESGILDGVTRHHILRIAEADGLSVEDRTVPMKELDEADEVFIASTLKEIIPVVRIDGRPVGQERPGMITDRLLGLYQTHAIDATRPSREEDGPPNC